MKIFLSIFSLLCCFSFAQAQNTNITLNSDLNLNCKFEKVILKNPDHNFESFTKDQIKRKDINKLIIESKTPDILNVKNLSEFFNKIDLIKDKINFKKDIISSLLNNIKETKNIKLFFISSLNKKDPKKAKMIRVNNGIDQHLTLF